MHTEEGIADVGDPKKARGIRHFDTKCLHRYHLFFLEIGYPSTLLPSRQGHCQPNT